MTTTHLYRNKKIVEKETEFFGDTHKRNLPGNIAFNPIDIGEFGKERRPQRPKTYAQKLADKQKLEREAAAHRKDRGHGGYKRATVKSEVVGMFGNSNPVNPTNVDNTEDIGEFGKHILPKHHKAAIKKVHKHVLGLDRIIPQKISHPGIVPRNIGMFGSVNPTGAGSLDWYREMDKIVKKHTGWDSLRQMCLNYPTLMVSKGSTANESQAIYMMRAAYKFVTGREAFPAENWDLSKRKRR